MARTKTNTMNDTKNSYNIMTQQTFRQTIFLCFSIDQRLRANVFVYVCTFVKRMIGAVHRRV